MNMNYDDLKDMNFTNKQTYLTWRGQWRDAYKSLSQSIKEQKINVKSLQRSGEITYKILYTLNSSRWQAHKMMVLLSEAKEKSAAIRDKSALNQLA